MEHMPIPTKEAILEALDGVQDPEIKRPITELNMVESVEIGDAGDVTVTVLLTIAGCPLKSTLERDTEAAVRGVEGVTDVTVRLGVMSEEQRVAGVIENMSWLELPDGTRQELFGSGGGRQVADSLSRSVGAPVELLGQIPLDVSLREGADVGAPVVLSKPDSPAAVALRGIAKGLGTKSRGLAGRSLGLTPAGR